MNDVNNFQISKGNIRQVSEEEKAFMEGRDVKSRQTFMDSTPAEAAEGIVRMVPDGRGGFRPVASPPPEVVVEKPSPEHGGERAEAGSPEAETREVTPGPPVAAQTRQPAVSPDEGVIRIVDARKRVDLECAGKFGDKDGVFAIGMTAVSVDVTKDGVSVLVRDDVDICPPTLCNMRLRVDGAAYEVLYAGGKHRLGGYINMPFVRI